MHHIHRRHHQQLNKCSLNDLLVLIFLKMATVKYKPACFPYHKLDNVGNLTTKYLVMNLNNRRLRNSPNISSEVFKFNKESLCVSTSQKDDLL